jgi:tetratricopeptide (TPR) repeat protein
MSLSDDEDYELVTAACYIRLRKYEAAVVILEKLLARSPNNLKALYNLSFCRRAGGLQKDAIADLSKVLLIGGISCSLIVSNINVVQIISMNKSETQQLAIPLHRVYEMRGTMFHEVQGLSLTFIFSYFFGSLISQYRFLS